MEVQLSEAKQQPWPLAHSPLSSLQAMLETGRQKSAVLDFPPAKAAASEGFVLSLALPGALHWDLSSLKAAAEPFPITVTLGSV